MAHLLFVKDTVSGDCGLAIPPCLPEHLAGPVAGIPLCSTLPLGSTYNATDTNELYQVANAGSGTCEWVLVEGPPETLTTIAWDAANQQINYVDENAVTTTLTIPRHVHTAGPVPPVAPAPGDTWYDTTCDTTFEWTYDGANWWWVDRTN